mmetsp:Transcript_72755/g.170605  ORF Transcript_72755/g.170605 Transcript_72755/m.170605 type:complete len:220 (+) Transcript_72755:299-958(+)
MSRSAALRLRGPRSGCRAPGVANASGAHLLLRFRRVWHHGQCLRSGCTDDSWRSHAGPEHHMGKGDEQCRQRRCGRARGRRVAGSQLHVAPNGYELSICHRRQLEDSFELVVGGGRNSAAVPGRAAGDNPGSAFPLGRHSCQCWSAGPDGFLFPGGTAAFEDSGCFHGRGVVAHCADADRHAQDHIPGAWRGRLRSSLGPGQKERPRGALCGRHRQLRW